MYNEFDRITEVDVQEIADEVAQEVYNYTAEVQNADDATRREIGYLTAQSYTGREPFFQFFYEQGLSFIESLREMGRFIADAFYRIDLRLAEESEC